MTTITMKKSNNNLPLKTLATFILMILIFGILGFSYIPLQKPTILKTHTIVVVSGHAWQGHGTEANQALKCLDKNGSTKSFITFGFEIGNGKMLPTNVWICFDKIKTTWFAVITTTFQRIAFGQKEANLVTAYKIDQQLFPDIAKFEEYLITKWGGKQIDYIIPAYDINIITK